MTLYFTPSNWKKKCNTLINEGKVVGKLLSYTRKMGLKSGTDVLEGKLAASIMGLDPASPFFTSASEKQ